MCRRVVCALSFVVTAREHLAVRDPYDERADGDVVVRERGARFGERVLHQRVGRVRLHGAGAYRSCVDARSATMARMATTDETITERVRRGAPVIADGAVETRVMFRSGVRMDPDVQVAAMVGDPAGGSVLRVVFAGYVSVAKSHALPVVIGTPTFRASARYVQRAATFPSVGEATGAALAMRDTGVPAVVSSEWAAAMWSLREEFGVPCSADAAVPTTVTSTRSRV